MPVYAGSGAIGCGGADAQATLRFVWAWALPASLSIPWVWVCDGRGVVARLQLTALIKLGIGFREKVILTFLRPPPLPEGLFR